MEQLYMHDLMQQAALWDQVHFSALFLHQNCFSGDLESCSIFHAHCVHGCVWNTDMGGRRVSFCSRERWLRHFGVISNAIDEVSGDLFLVCLHLIAQSQFARAMCDTAIRLNQDVVVVT